MMAFLHDENNMDTIREELAARNVLDTNLWDALFDLIFLDAFEGKFFSLNLIVLGR